MAGLLSEWRKPVTILTGIILFGLATWASWFHSFRIDTPDQDISPEIALLDKRAELKIEGYYSQPAPFTYLSIVRRYAEATDVSGRAIPRSDVGYLVASPRIADLLRRCSYRDSPGTLTEVESLPADLVSSVNFRADSWLDNYRVFTFNSSVECAAPDSAFWAQSGARFTFASPALSVFTLDNQGQFAASSPTATCASVSVTWQGEEPVELAAQWPSPMTVDSHTNASTWSDCQLVDKVGLIQDYQLPTATSVIDLSIQDASNRWLFAGGAFAGILGALGVELFLSIYEITDRRRAKLPTPDWEPDPQAYL